MHAADPCGGSTRLTSAGVCCIALVTRVMQGHDVSTLTARYHREVCGRPGRKPCVHCRHPCTKGGSVMLRTVIAVLVIVILVIVILQLT
jgi:hypothetical protein